eukprot:gene12110-16213_t
MGNEQSFDVPSEFKFVSTKCRIVVVGAKSGDDALTELSKLPPQARILATGNNLEELRKDGNLFSEGNVLFNVTGNAEVLDEIINEMPFLVWIHSITAGVDHILCPAITQNNDLILTNARGVFSSSLAEYTMAACSYFAKDIPRLLKQKQDHNWNKFCVSELRGKTMGIVGYGSIGYACAKLAKAYGMRVLALRRNPQLSANDSNIDECFSTDKLNEVMSQSDYLVVSLALTKETFGFIGRDNFKYAKKGMIFINIGRGALVDELQMIMALENGTLGGAALDVFTTEPLPPTSPLWDIPNILISPHNADLLKDSRHRSVVLFTENCAKFVAGEELNYIVDKENGY